MSMAAVAVRNMRKKQQQQQQQLQQQQLQNTNSTPPVAIKGCKRSASIDSSFSQGSNKSVVKQTIVEEVKKVVNPPRNPKD